jgi:hypothetical protein
MSYCLNIMQKLLDKRGSELHLWLCLRIRAQKKSVPTVREILNELRTKPTTSVPNAGKVLGDLSANSAYDAARKGELGVPTFWVGGKLRVPSIAVLERLGLSGELTPPAVEALPPAPPPPVSRPTTHKRAASQRRAA